MSNYIGIDYSLGKSNFDPASGIHYGVISQNSVNQDCMQDVEYEYGTAHCPKCGNDIVASDHESIAAAVEDADWFDGQDYTCIHCQACYWSDECFSEESSGWSYQSEGYKLTDCLDNDIFVLASPYYTFAQYCSPCVPGAGNLDNPMPDGIKTYALGHDWFDDGAPYPLYSVATNQEVTK